MAGWSAPWVAGARWGRSDKVAPTGPPPLPLAVVVVVVAGASCAVSFTIGAVVSSLGEDIVTLLFFVPLVYRLGCVRLESFVSWLQICS